MTAALFARLLWLSALGKLAGRNKWLLPESPPAPPEFKGVEEMAWLTTFPKSRCV